MVATQVLISLCVAGLTVAAPQLDLPGVQRTVTTVAVNDVNEDALVTDVVSALQPSIALAVANALRSLQTTTTTISDRAQIGGTASTGQISSSGFSSSSAAKSSSSAAKSTSSFSAAAEKAAFEQEFAANAEPTTRPEYNFEYKVADGEEQTYLTQQESRDGDELTGSYSYVDPEGALITVNYQAGPDGFSQTTDKQEGFIQIVSKPPRLTASAAGASSSSSSSSSGSKFTSAASGASNAGASFSSQTASNSASSSVDQSALIAQILAALQPQISASVNAALTSSQSRTSVINVPAAPVAVAAAPVALAARPVQVAARPVQVATKAVQAAASGNLASLFGDGYAVRIATPEFKIEY